MYSIRRKLAVVAMAGAVGSMTLATAAYALPNGNDAKGTVARCIDHLYGNATNPRSDGNGVLPSLAPGPEDMDGGFLSVGEVAKNASSYVDGQTVKGTDLLEYMCTFP